MSKKREASTFVDLLRERACDFPDREAFVFLEDGESEGERFTFRELELAARGVGARLQELGLRGERAVLVFAPGPEYVRAFWGCLFAGVVAVPAYPPRGRRGLPRLQAILEDARPAVVLTTKARRETLASWLEEEGLAKEGLAKGGLAVVATDIAVAGRHEAWREPEVDAESLAFLQYTSGSTSAPKGVMLSHRNLLENERMIRQAFRTEADSVVVSWLPLYHDMGLIGGMLHPVFLGCRAVLFSPVHFLRSPRLWLRAISRYRATVSGAPSFAYELCAERIGEGEASTLDLRSWEVAFNGAEPVRAETLERFARKFEASGFRRTAFFPCYGLAEATLLVAGGKKAPEPRVLTLDGASLEEHRVVARDDQDEGGRRLVSCGDVPSDLDVRVVDPSSLRECPLGAVGEVWVAGTSVAEGYWNRPRKSAETFGARLDAPRSSAGPFLRTGDLGFVDGGELFLTGRIKDLIIIRGRNLYPQDIEAVMEKSHPALRPGGGAAFSVPVSGEERLVLVQEVDLRRRPRAKGAADGLDPAAIRDAVCRSVAEEFEVWVEAVVLIRPGDLSKTTSGKVQRQACRARYLAQDFKVVLAGGGTTRGAESPLARPRGAREEKVLRVWAEVLERDAATLGVDRSFFELGGDSVRAVRLAGRLREIFGVDLSLDALFDAATIAGMAVLIEQALGEGRPDEEDGPPEEDGIFGSGVSRRARRGALPLSSPQRRLWFLDRLEPGNPAYNLAIAFDFPEALDPALLGRAMAVLFERHAALRAVFGIEDGAPVQRLRPRLRWNPAVADLGRLDPRRQQVEGSRLEAVFARRPFDLAASVAPRLLLLRLAERRWRPVLAMHHIISDGASLEILVRELLQLYRGAPLGAAPAEYAEHLLRNERRETAAAPLEAWRRRLAGPPPLVELPADRPRPAVLGYRGAHHERPLPAALTASLRALGASRGAPLFMVLLAGFVAWIRRYTGLRDIVVGTAADQRDRPELTGLVGLWVNTLPLRTDAGGDPPFVELLERVRRTALDAYAHRDVSFERLVEELGGPRDPSHRALVQVMLVLQDVSASLDAAAAGRAGGELPVWEVDNGTARFDLALSWRARSGQGHDGALVGTWKYHRDLFDPTTTRRMAAHLERWLESAAADPERRISALELWSAAERAQVLLGFNDTAADGGAPAGLHDAVAEVARRFPHRIALVCEEEAICYGELRLRSSRLARSLRRLGVGPEVLVGVLMERSTELLVALLGILEAGGAYLPLDPSYPAERLRYMVKTARVPLVLTQERLRRFPVSAPRTLVLGPGGAEILEGAPEKGAAERERGASSAPAPANLAYVIFTSGSTGRPKGAGIPHRGIVNRLVWMQEAYRLTADDVVLLKTPYSFDVSVWELFWAFREGARLLVARPGGHQDSAYLAELLSERRVTTLHFVPSMLQVFVEEPRFEARSALRRVIVSGEALPYDLQQRFFARSDAELHNLYGPTEASVDVTSWACRRRGTERLVPLGRPIRNIRIHVLDPSGRPLPTFVPGELSIAGVGLARGYLGRPGLTAERFVADALAPAPGGRVYRTGDLVRYRTDGTLEFLGRLDHQIKVRGFRIELGEIESVLTGRAEVREAVVVALSEGGGTRLVAYVVPPEGAPLDAGELSSHLAGQVPEYMVPGEILVLDALPLTPSGKVDRRALPAPGKRPGADAPAAPRGRLEERLAELWRGQLGVETLGVHDDFFAVGGDSVRGALLINRLQRELRSVIYVMALFEHPTVARFAAYLKENYPAALTAAGWLEAPEEAGEAGDLGDEEIQEMEERLAALFPAGPSSGAAARPEVKNPRAVFLLSPFRSGSTLLRVMLAGHPRLFAPPELELLGFETLAARHKALSGPLAFAREGLLRALMELHGGDAAAAEARLAEHAQDSGRDFYRRLGEWAGGRLLVDKTPRYALDPSALERAEHWFEKPLYVHLLRHPCGMVLSYEKARMDQAYPFPLKVRRQAEALWQISHRNIRFFLAGIPRERQLALSFEELVERPRETLEGLCAFLGVPFVEATLRPYDGERMTDGIVAGGRMMGDPTFHEHRRIDPAVAHRWRAAPVPVRLGRATWRLAAELGYAPPHEEASLEETAAEEAGGAAAIVPVPRDGELPLSFGQQRLWFLDRLQGGGDAAYNMPGAVRLRGRLDRGALRRTFAAVVKRHEVLRTVYPDAAGRPRQRLLAPRPPALPTADLRRMATARRAAAGRHLLAREARRPFDLGRGPLLRLVLVRLAEEEHVLLVVLHHIVADGWSIGLLVREVAALYAASLDAASLDAASLDAVSLDAVSLDAASLDAVSLDAAFPSELSPLPELAVQYADYAAWQRRRLSGGVREELLAYWRERLASPLPVLELPADRPRPAVPKQLGARAALRLASASTSRLHTLARQRGTTLFVVLTSLLKTLLHRHSGQTDLVLGIPVAHRNRLEVENLIGFFVNTLAVRGDLSGDPTFAGFLGAVHDIWKGASRHEEMPFEMLVEELGVRRELSHAPLFQVLFAFQNAPMATLRLPELELELLEVETRTAKFDLLLNLMERDGELVGWLEYSTELFDATTAARLLGRFQALAVDADESAGRPLSRLALLNAAERQQALVEWNDTAVDREGSDGLLHGAILDRVRELPDATALSCEGAWLSYAEMARRSAHLARRLISLGVGPEVVVGISAERSLEMVLGLLAVLRSGGAYLPLDPVYPPARLEFVASRSRAPVILCQKHLLDRLPPLASHILILEEELTVPKRAEVRAGLQVRGLQAKNPAYVIYTSGSTGEPKGVMIPHRGIDNRLLWMQEAYGLGRGDVVLQKTPYSFDVSVWEFFWPLRVGARLSILRPGGHQDSAYLAEHIVRERVSTLHFVPSMLQLYVEEPRAGLAPSLRWLITSGEALPADLAQRCLARSEARLENLYGPTEASVDVTYQPCRRGDRRASVPIGRPIAGLRLLVLERGGEPAPVGVPGELMIGGVGLARSYLGRPDLTARSFVPDPTRAVAGGAAGERLYRTGDLARTLASGEIDFLGRLDHQVKIRGLRIELGEIETCLLRHPEVREAVVTVREDRPGDQRLVAYLVASGTMPSATVSSATVSGATVSGATVSGATVSGATVSGATVSGATVSGATVSGAPVPSASELRGFLARKLPDYMNPAIFVLLDALPLSKNGKIDRKALPAPSASRSELAARSVSPRNERERVMARVWKELLGLNEVGIHDNFFELGGHSLLAAEAHARLQQELGVELSLMEAFQHPTIHALSERLERRRDAPREAFQGVRHSASREKSARRRRALKRRRKGPL